MPAADTRPLDDVLLAMDVVDTLRHREQALARELDAVGRETALLDRLREIYKAQGIEVPDHVLQEGVRALEEQRFQYKPPKRTLSVRLAEVYVSRARWWKPVVGLLTAIAIGLGVYQLGVAGPAQARAAAIEAELSTGLPDELQTIHRAIMNISDEDVALRRADTFLQDGLQAVEARNVEGGRAAVENLKELRTDITTSYDVRVVYGPDEPRSGVFRIPNDAPNTRNYYLIVEAVDPAGRLVEVPITNEENGETRRVTRWGQRVSASAFDTIASDKRDDQIIQNAVIGQKIVGRLSPDFSVETPGGAILEW
ncbi:MAG: DUF6384 family protein [Henriciella sp.]|nr:DUF6384 family protein [Henriciella sp.]